MASIDETVLMVSPDTGKVGPVRLNRVDAHKDAGYQLARPKDVQREAQGGALPGGDVIPEFRQGEYGMAGPMVGGTVGSMAGGFFGGPVGSAIGDYVGTAGGYLYEGAPPLDAAALAAEDFATGLVGGQVLKRAGKIPGVDALVGKAGQYADEVIGSVGGKVEDLAGMVRRKPVDMGIEDIAEARRVAQQNPGRLTPAQGEILARQIMDDVKGVNLSAADLGDSTAKRLRTSGLSSPLASQQQRIIDAVEDNKRAFLGYADSVNIDKRDAGEQVRNMLASAKAQIQERDAAIFREAVSPEWDASSARSLVADKMADVKKTLNPYDIAKTDKAGAGTRFREYAGKYDDIMAALSDPDVYRQFYGDMPAPIAIDKLRREAGDAMEVLHRTGAKGDAKDVGKVYSALVDAQAAFLPQAQQDAWATARKRYAEYLEHLPEVEKYLDESLDIGQLVDKVSRGANGGKLIEAIEFFAREAGREDVVTVLYDSKLTNMLLDSKGAQSFNNALQKLPPEVRERYGRERIAKAAGLAQIDDYIKSAGRDISRPGSGVGRLTHNSILKYLSTGIVSAELYKAYEDIGTKGIAELTKKGAWGAVKVLQELGMRAARQSVNEAGMGPIGAYGAANQAVYERNLSELGYAAPQGDPQGMPVPLSTLAGE